MLKSVLLATAVVAFATLTGDRATAAKSFLGQDAPAIQSGDWINGDGRTDLGDFKGELVFIEFWQSH